MAVLDSVRRGRFAAFRRRQDRNAVFAGLLAGSLGLVWALWLARDAGDLAAQNAWANFVGHYPWSAYNLSWYGGVHPASYSVISPYLMAWIGVRTTGVLACTGSAVLGGLLFSRSGVRRPLIPALALALALWCNLSAGRVTYLLGMTLALTTAVLVLPGTSRHPPRPVPAAAVAVVATLCSPVAGLFVEVLAAALFLTGRRRLAYLLAPGPAVVVAVTSLLFPFSGVQPFPWYSAVFTVGVGVVVAVLTPATWRTVRAGAWVYAVGAGLCWVVPSPIGSNVERLALLASAAILICACTAVERRGRRAIATYAAAAGLMVWTTVPPVVDVIHTVRVTATATDVQPLITELRRVGAQQGRVEVVPLRTHRESSALSPYLDLARGWNRQADVERNPLFYRGVLTASSYLGWLRDWGVAYVVLPAAELDSAGVAEAGIIAAGNPSLPLVWQDAGWRVYRVQGVMPLAAAPATMTYAGPAAYTVRMPQAGSVLLRIAWSPWLAITPTGHDATPHACLARSGTWTELRAPAAGTFTIEAPYALDRGTPCTGAASH